MVLGLKRPRMSVGSGRQRLIRGLRHRDLSSSDSDLAGMLVDNFRSVESATGLDVGRGPTYGTLVRGVTATRTSGFHFRLCLGNKLDRRNTGPRLLGETTFRLPGLSGTDVDIHQTANATSPSITATTTSTSCVGSCIQLLVECPQHNYAAPTFVDLAARLRNPGGHSGRHMRTNAPASISLSKCRSTCSRQLPTC